MISEGKFFGIFLPLKITISGNFVPSARTVRTHVKRFFSFSVIQIYTVFASRSSIVKFPTISKKTGVSSIFPISKSSYSNFFRFSIINR